MGGRQQNGPSHAAARGKDVALRGGQLGEMWWVSQEAGSCKWGVDHKPGSGWEMGCLPGCWHR